jgi:hypothetical protein
MMAMTAEMITKITIRICMMIQKRGSSDILRFRMAGDRHVLEPPSRRTAAVRARRYSMIACRSAIATA